MINLTEILERHSNSYRIHGNDANIIPECAIDAMREAVRQALELAANEATVEWYYTTDEPMKALYRVRKSSILNVINKVALKT